MTPPESPRRVKWGWNNSVKLTKPCSRILAMEQRPSENVPSTGLSRGSSEAVEFQSPTRIVCALLRGTTALRIVRARAARAP